MVKITSVGDVCVDIYPQENRFVLGGTAFNRAKWLAQNGVQVSLVSAIGNDDWGKQYLKVCRNLKINTNYLTVLPGQTSQVEIALDQNKSPHFSAWNLGVLKNFRPEKWPQNQDALITTGLKPIKQLLDLPPARFTAADFDGDSPYTFNQRQIQQYAARFDLIVSSKKITLGHPKVLITSGAGGSRLITPGKTYFEPAKKITTPDTTGAGDAFISAFVLTRSLKLATKAAAQTITAPRNSGV